jgi:hypothetical protein
MALIGDEEKMYRDDFGELTEADMTMLRHAMQSGADETDYSDFYLEGWVTD